MEKSLKARKFVFNFFISFSLLTLIFNVAFIEQLAIDFFLIIAKLLLLSFSPDTWSILSHQITINGNHLIMIKECTGLPMYALFSAFAVSYDNNFKKNYKYIFIGLLLLTFLNITRMFTIMISAFINRSLMNFIHDFLWPATFFIFVLVVIQFYIEGVKLE